MILIRAISQQAASQEFPELSLPVLEGEEEAEAERESQQDSSEENKDGHR